MAMRFIPSRHWFQWSLRTLFVVFTVVACTLGYELNWIRQRHELLTTGRFVAHDDGTAPGGLILVGVRAPGLLWLLGESGHQSISVMLHGGSSNQSDDSIWAEEADLERILHLFPESVVALRSAHGG
jgi:hypothetical protein